MAKYSFLDYAEDALKLADRPLTYQEIWKFGLDKDFYKNLKTITGRTPALSLGSIMYVDIRDNPDSKFTKVGRYPARFFLKSKMPTLKGNWLEKAQEKERKEDEQITKAIKYKEKELRPLLAYFVYANAGFNRGKAVYTKTILHEESKKGKYMQWTHPDMVGFYIPISDWNEKLLKFNDISDSNSIKLFSFELKKRIGKSDYRECFFQTVSNSSWANEGYLVAAEIEDDDELKGELERLSASFGIGIIHIDLDDIDASNVLFSAKTKSNLDWELMNKLSEQNKGFEKFIDDVIDAHSTKKIKKQDYDEIIETDNIAGYIKKVKSS